MNAASDVEKIADAMGVYGDQLRLLLAVENKPTWRLGAGEVRRII
jgi:hypothetical protein